MKTLNSTIWLGTMGSLLIVGGIIALLASNWVYIPFFVQVAIAFIPLVLGWIGFVMLVIRGITSLSYHEILGEGTI